MYALSNRREAYDNKLQRQGGSTINPGLCVYDFSRLLEGSLEMHTLSDAMVHCNNFIDYNVKSQTISFIKDYSSIVMIPLLHRNNV